MHRAYIYGRFAGCVWFLPKVEVFGRFLQNIVPEGVGICTFLKFAGNGCFGKVWVMGGPEATFLSTEGRLLNCPSFRPAAVQAPEEVSLL